MKIIELQLGKTCVGKACVGSGASLRLWGKHTDSAFFQLISRFSFKKSYTMVNILLESVSPAFSPYWSCVPAIPVKMDRAVAWHQSFSVILRRLEYKSQRSVKRHSHLYRSPECFDFCSVFPQDENGLLRHYFPLLEGCGCPLLFLKMSFTFFHEVIS